MNSFLFPALVRFQLKGNGKSYDNGYWVLSIHLACDQLFLFVVLFCFQIIVLLCSWLHVNIFVIYINAAKTNFCILLNLFPSWVLPLRCLVSCLKRHSHMYSLFSCIKLITVSYQQQSGDHIFVLVDFLITWGIRKKENTWSMLPKLLFLTDSLRHMGAREIVQPYT